MHPAVRSSSSSCRIAIFRIHLADIPSVSAGRMRAPTWSRWTATEGVRADSEQTAQLLILLYDKPLK